MTEAAPSKVSKSEILEPLNSAAANAAWLAAMQRLWLKPEPLKFHKAKRDGSGCALKADLRLDVEFGKGKAGRTFVKDVDGAVFLDIVQQSGANAGGDPTFAWDDQATKLTAKLGMNDVSTLLVAMRCRWAGKAIPEEYAPKGDTSGAAVGLFHSFEGDDGKSTTSVAYTMSKSGAFLKLAKSKEHQRSVKLLVHEELQLQAFLEHALTMFILVGKR